MLGFNIVMSGNIIIEQKEISWVIGNPYFFFFSKKLITERKYGDSIKKWSLNSESLCYLLKKNTTFIELVNENFDRTKRCPRRNRSK